MISKFTEFFLNKTGESVCIVLLLINEIEISHNYLCRKVLRRPLPVRNYQRWAVYITVAQ